MWSLAKVQQRVDRTAQIRLPFTYSIIEGNPKRIEGRPLRTLDAAAAALPLLLSRRCNSLRVLTRGCHPNVAACYIESFTSFSHVGRTLQPGCIIRYQRTELWREGPIKTWQPNRNIEFQYDTQCQKDYISFFFLGGGREKAT